MDKPGKGWFGAAGAVASLARRLPVWAKARRRTAIQVVDGLFVNLAMLSRRQPWASAGRHGIELCRDVPYLDSGLAAHTLDIYRPTRRLAPWPVVLYVHGGGFRILSKESHWLMALMFARRGYLVFNINYRLAPEHKYPAAIEDVCAAYRWVARNAEAFGGDLSQLVLAGESAGANLVTALSVATSFTRPEPWARAAFEAGVQPVAVLPACGILQVSDVERLRREGHTRMLPLVFEYLQVVSEAYLPASHDLDVDLDLADPLVVLERDTPSDRPLPAYFVTVGGKDPLVDDTLRLARALERRGADVESKVYPGQPHAFHAYIWSKVARQAWRDSFGFLRQRLGPRVDGGRVTRDTPARPAGASSEAESPAPSA